MADSGAAAPTGGAAAVGYLGGMTSREPWARSLHRPWVVSTWRSPVRPRFASSLLLFSALLSACSSDERPALGADEMGEQDKEEVASAVGAALSRSFSSEDGLARTSVDVAMGAPPAWLGELDVDVHAGELLGLSIELDAACLDGDGGEMSACDATSDGAAISADVDGEVSLLGWTGSVSIALDWQLAGLQSDEVAVTGSAEIELGSEFVEWFRPITHTATFSITAEYTATLDRDDFTAISGSADLSIDYERTRSDDPDAGARFAFTVEATVEDGRAELRIGGLLFRVDLRTGAATRM